MSSTVRDLLILTDVVGVVTCVEWSPNCPRDNVPPMLREAARANLLAPIRISCWRVHGHTILGYWPEWRLAGEFLWNGGSEVQWP